DPGRNPRPVAVYGLDPNSWKANTVTWNTRPSAITAALDSVSIDVSSAKYNEFDVTDYVRAHTGDRISFMLAAASQHIVTEFHSSEGTNKPELVITTGTGGEEPPPAVRVPVV